MTLPLVLAALAMLLVLIALVEAAAARLALPQSVMLAALGVALGAFAALFPGEGIVGLAASLFADLPLAAQTLMLLLLPPLLFDAGLKIDARRMIDDGATIFLLAVVAVCLTTFAVGLALAPLGLAPLAVCLLVGAIVSTTDPLAVIGIFKDVGAPARLVRIIEGESLLNDAAAIALFAILLTAVREAGGVSFVDGVVLFLVSGLGGLAVGAAMALAATPLMAATRNHPAALMSVTVALPYLAYIACEALLGISGAMAVIAAGLVTAGRADAGRAPAAWAHVREIWGQLSFWASSLVFVLAAFLVPALLTGLSAQTVLASAVTVAALFAARAIVLWGFLPLLQRAALAQKVGHRAKVLLWWGGLRGALTLLLALSVTEHEEVAAASKEFVAVLATAATLFTILVNGLTLRPLTRALRLNTLTTFDRGLSEAARALANDVAARAVRLAAREHGIAEAVAERALAAYADASRSEGAVPISAKARLALSLMVLAQAERTLLARHVGNEVISPHVAVRLHREAQRMGEAARATGRLGYLDAAQRMLRFGVGFRVALLAQRWFGMRGPLSRALADRFERLMVRRLVIAELDAFCTERIAPVLGGRVAQFSSTILARRRALLSDALAALGLQYPHYANLLEQRFLERIALATEDREYRALRQEGLIGTEISSALREELARTNQRFARALTLDLSVDKRALVARLPLFSGLADAALGEIARRLRTRFVVPGERIITRGERGDSVYFIASGAVEVDTGAERIRLGRGTCVGELAAFSGARRSAHVTMLGFGELLVLDGRAFRKLLERDARLRREVERLVNARSAREAEGPYGRGEMGASPAS